ncbi:hypothetical protein RhiJN_28272 [Ceratobasidium sp. AG-Ba]|nr:hypothetical protein RhiJN_28272 [Ceratobasidium sp. AG-Ba]
MLRALKPRVPPVARTLSIHVTATKFIAATILVKISGSWSTYSSLIKDDGNLEPDKADEGQRGADHQANGEKPKHMSRGKLLAAHRARVVPELKEGDLEETFVRGI